MFVIIDHRDTPPEQVTDQKGADDAWLRFVEEGFALSPSRCTSRDTVLVRGDEEVTIRYQSAL